MALKDRFRRALRMSGSNASESTHRNPSVSESNSSQDATSSHTLQSARSESSGQPSAPSITLTKTTSRLSKKLTGRSEKDDEERERRRKEKEWEAFAPRKYLWLRASKEREVLTGFEWKWRNSREGRRSSSLYSGISPGTSRRVSLEEDSRRRVVEDGIGAGEDGIHGSSAAT